MGCRRLPRLAFLERADDPQGSRIRSCRQAARSRARLGAGKRRLPRCRCRVLRCQVRVLGHAAIHGGNPEFKALFRPPIIRAIRLPMDACRLRPGAPLRLSFRATATNSGRWPSRPRRLACGPVSTSLRRPRPSKARRGGGRAGPSLRDFTAPTLAQPDGRRGSFANLQRADRVSSDHRNPGGAVFRKMWPLASNLKKDPGRQISGWEARLRPLPRHRHQARSWHQRSTSGHGRGMKQS